MDVIMPQLGETVAEGTVSVWHKKAGDQVEEGETLFDVSTDKVEMEIPAPASGRLVEILVPEGETVEVGARLAIIGDGSPAEATPSAPSPSVPGQSAPTPSKPAAPIAPAKSAGGKRDARGNPLSPVVRRLIAEHGLDPASIEGTGGGGRITRKDVMAHLEGGGGAPAPSPEAGRTVIPFDRLRKLTAEHMARSKAVSPHVLQAVEVDFHNVDRARATVREDWKSRHGFSLTYLPFIARAVCEAIADFPRINAHVEGDSLVQFERINLGIAVDLNLKGLIVPVIKDAGAKSLTELALAAQALAAKARDKKLRPDDLTGGTYTLSNAGTFGTMITAPIINQPQVAILSLDGIRKKPAVVEGPAGDEIAIRPIGVLAQSFDHRAIDGAYSAAFLDKLRGILEQRDWLAELG